MSDGRWIWGIMLLEIDRKHGVVWCELVVYRGARLFAYDLALQKIANECGGSIVHLPHYGEIDCSYFSHANGELVRLLPPVLAIPYALTEKEFFGSTSEWLTVNCWLDVLLSNVFPEQFPADKLEESFAHRAEIAQRVSAIPGVPR